MNKHEFDINVYNIAYMESKGQYGEKHFGIIEFAKRYLFSKEKYFTYQTLVERFNDEMGGILEENLKTENINIFVNSLLQKYPNRFFHSEVQQEVLDFADNDLIPLEENAFNYFFAFRLFRISNFDTFEFLNYHLKNTYVEDKTAFKNDLILTLREFKSLLEQGSNYYTVIDYIRKLDTLNYSEVIEKSRGYGFENLFKEDKLFQDNFASYLKIEEELYKHGYLIIDEGNIKWNRKKKPFMKIEYLIAFILLLFESKYFNIKIFNERSQLYRVAFEKRFNVDIKKQFQKNLRKKIKTEKYKLFFEFIKPPETAK